MKKWIALLLALVMIIGISAAFAGDDAWTCPNGGREDNDSAFCPDCGTRKPEEEATPEPKAAAETDIEVGDYVYFGKYEQSRNGDSTKIRWLVIDEDNGNLFLLSELGLARHRFNQSSNGATWAECELRHWLNDTFLKTAFDKKEREKILTTEVDDGPDHTNYAWDTAGRTGYITDDKIFLLSYEEMNSLVSSDDRLCEPSAAVRAMGVYTEKHNNKTCCWYWLRTSAFRNNAGVIDASGKFETCYIHHDYGVVRPALWVEASAVTKDTKNK